MRNQRNRFNRLCARAILFSACAMLVMLSTNVFDIGPAIAQSPSDLIAKWDFDEGAGTALHDVSGNGNDGIIVGATWVDGVNGKALSFDGVDDSVLLTNPSSPYHQSVTVEAWVKSPSPTSSSYAVFVTREHGTITYAYRLQMYSSTGRFEFVTSNTRTMEIVSTTVAAPNMWYHVAGVWNDYNKTLAIYVNGELESIAARSGTLDYTDGQFYIGCYSGGAMLNGVLDEVTIYNKALTSTAIRASYRSIAVNNTVNPGNDTVPGDETNDDTTVETETTWLWMAIMVFASVIVLIIVVAAFMLVQKPKKHDEFPAWNHVPPQGPPPPAFVHHPAPEQTTLNKRLRELKELKENGLISEDEFQMKREEILKDI